MTASWWRSVAGPGEVRDCRSGIAQGGAPAPRGPRCSGGGSRCASCLGRGQDHLAVDEVDDAVDDLVLVGDVVVDGHRLDAQLLRERADRQRPDTPGVGDGHRAPQHPLAAEGARSCGLSLTGLTMFPLALCCQTLALSYLVR